jgi:2-methylcitrate dehydratase PrpD
VETFARAVALDNRVNPETAEAAQFSLPFVLGIAALFGRDHLLPLNTELLGNASVIDFGSKVTMLVDNQIDALFPVQTAARVIVEGVGGRGRWEHFVEHPLGDPANPLGRAGLQDKFCHLTSPFFSSQNQNEMLASISTFRDGGFRELIQVLGKPLHPIESTNNISPENITK